MLVQTFLQLGVHVLVHPGDLRERAPFFTNTSLSLSNSKPASFSASSSAMSVRGIRSLLEHLFEVIRSLSVSLCSENDDIVIYYDQTKGLT